MIERGALLRVKTRTKDDVFGEVVYEVVETGLPSPERERALAGERDGLKCVMLGGTGKAARAGYVVYDSSAKIEQDVAAGITQIIPASQKASIQQFYDGKAAGKSTGVVELE